MQIFLTSPRIAPILLLCASNFFMTCAWYGHLKFTRVSLPLAIFVSWAIALFEYCLAVPANRIGYGFYSAAQLKTLQEIITLVIFMIFSFLVLDETPNMRTILGFSLIGLGSFFIFQPKWRDKTWPPSPSVINIGKSAYVLWPSHKTWRINRRFRDHWYVLPPTVPRFTHHCWRSHCMGARTSTHRGVSEWTALWSRT